MTEKPFIKFCTPFYNEWRYRKAGRSWCEVIRNDPPLPIERSFDELASRCAGHEQQYEPGDVIDGPDFAFRWVRNRGTYIARTRNSLVNDNVSKRIHQKLDENYTHYFFVDADIEFTYEQALSLIRSDWPITSGCYTERTHPECDTAGFVIDNHLDFWKRAETGLVPVDWCGMGFCCIKRAVFEAVPYRWFECRGWTYSDADGNECADSWEEDVSFCLKAKENGFATLLNTNCVVNHHLNQ